MGQETKRLRKRILVDTLHSEFTFDDVNNISTDEDRDALVFEATDEGLHIDVVVYRLETDEEQAKRLQQEAAHSNRLKQQRRERFFELYKEFGHELNQLQPLAQ